MDQVDQVDLVGLEVHSDWVDQVDLVGQEDLVGQVDLRDQKEVVLWDRMRQVVLFSVAQLHQGFQRYPACPCQVDQKDPLVHPDRQVLVDQGYPVDLEHHREDDLATSHLMESFQQRLVF